MARYESLVQVFAAHVRAQPDAPALIYAPDPMDDAGTVTVSYAELDAAARRIGARLAASYAPGDRALLLFQPGTAFAEAFLGALYAGLVAVPAPLPDGYKRQQDRLAGVARNAGTAVILTDGLSEYPVRGWARDCGLPEVPVLATDLDEQPAPGDWQPYPARPDTLAFLQYTSGSTRQPKGVMVDHANILANAEVFARIAELAGDSRVGGWLPMYHDFGLIGQLIVPLFLGSASVTMPATAFLKRPHTWLRLVDRHRITLSPAPNFAYDLCTRRITDEQLAGIDLSSWANAVNGSEPIQARTLDAFAGPVRRRRPAPERLAARVRDGRDHPGDQRRLAQASTDGHLGRPGKPGAARFRAHRRGRRRSPTGVQRRTAAARSTCGSSTRPPASSSRPAGSARSGYAATSVARGYWGEPELTREAFANPLVDRAGTALPGGYLRTGDLGILHDGELYVTGRIKELLIVKGRNLYPQDLEADARAAHETLSRGVGAVFTVAAARGAVGGGARVPHPGTRRRRARPDRQRDPPRPGPALRRRGERARPGPSRHRAAHHERQDPADAGPGAFPHRRARRRVRGAGPDPGPTARCRPSSPAAADDHPHPAGAAALPAPVSAAPVPASAPAHGTGAVVMGPRGPGR